ncbi:PTS system mannose/fructose/N-acetylgalactosamine-transporter subunit IIB [Tepidimicrobium xylanilyticum]|uniref:PTS system mannose/fructose/N-acetylgalactosamine-transporter subunit IIB n=1 Tax=Tepidimicrobium xylanilyticum TaxID=1123352 RepID=UPI00264CBFE2|nr:PTS sugar transporter subunit IIB [Tepidimicrobium xylanilyticum]GMG95343.1 PTS sugar transporter subunit IIB [Tepidimicrobium xylanilyticum]
MVNIIMVRVDERLVHGQITIKWVAAKKVNKIVIVDDETASDLLMKKVLRMTLPKSIELNIYGLDEGANFLVTTDSEDSAIVLVKNLWVAKELYERGVDIKEVNIGRLPSGIGKKKIHTNVFLSEEDIDIIGSFKNQGVSVFIQLVPDSTPINVHELEL